MAKEGLPDIPVSGIDARGLRVAVVASRWNAGVCDLLLERALATAREAGAEASGHRVAGALEIPVVAQALARRHDAVVALGCVVRGGTPHFDYVCESVTAGLTRVALDEGVPVGNGVLTVDHQEQAVDRAGGPGAAEDKGAEAMIAALDAALVLRRVAAGGGCDAHAE